MQLNVGDEGVSCHVDIPFFITTDHIHHPIGGFNAIRILQKKEVMLIFLTGSLKRHSVILILTR